VRNKNNFQLESAELDGSNRRVVCKTSPTKEFVVKKVVVGRENIFFADWKNRIVWKMANSGLKADDQVTIL
jgi:hypothetical protein